MPKKKIELFINIENEQEFEFMLQHNQNNLICADIYNSFAGPCTVLDYLFVRIKLDWSDGNIVLLRVLIDEIETLRRFRNQSEPVFLFIQNHRIKRIFRGVDNIRFAQAARQEIYYFNDTQKGCIVDRPSYELDQASPEELEWLQQHLYEKEQEATMAAARRRQRQEARKRHRAEMMVPHLRQLNFVLYWPHAIHAHHELYERWDENNIIMVGREEIQLTKELAEDVLYAGDAALNEASLHMLLSAPALAICFRLLDTEKHFVSLVRHILYEEVTPINDTKALEDQYVPQTAFDTYKSYSTSRQEIWERRREDNKKKKEEVTEKRARRLSEMQRLAKQAIEEAVYAKRAAKEQRKLQLLKAGNLSALEKFRDEPDDKEVDIVIPESLPDTEEVNSEVEDEDEYFPPAGLLIPGFYAPPNDIAKTNGLAILFPKHFPVGRHCEENCISLENYLLVLEMVTPEPEFLPPHILVMFDMDKRHRAIEVVSQYSKEIIHMGIFRMITVNDAIHVAYTVKQFDARLITKTYKLEKLKLAFMVSIQSDLALLELVSLGPVHVSRDVCAGEDECAALFDVNYGDNYPQFEDF